MVLTTNGALSHKIEHISVRLSPVEGLRKTFHTVWRSEKSFCKADQKQQEGFLPSVEMTNDALGNFA